MFGSGRMVRDSKQVLFFGIPYYHEKSSERAVGVDNAENGAWGFVNVKLTPTDVIPLNNMSRIRDKESNNANQVWFASPKLTLTNVEIVLFL